MQTFVEARAPGRTRAFRRESLAANSFAWEEATAGASRGFRRSPEDSRCGLRS